MQAGYTKDVRTDGRAPLVVVMNCIFTIPKRTEQPSLAPEQVPLVEVKTFTGETGLSALLYESDYSPVKLRRDVLLFGFDACSERQARGTRQVSRRLAVVHGWWSRYIRGCFKIGFHARRRIDC
jgi:hypothetical protein